MFYFLNYYSLSLFLGGVVALLSGAALFFNNDKKPERVPWMLLNLSSATWSFGYFVMSTATTKEIGLWSNWILHFGAILIPLFYLYFILRLTNSYHNYRKVFLTLIPVAIFFIIINPTNFFIRDVFAKGSFNFAPDAGLLYFYFMLYFFAVSIYAQVILFRAIKTTPGTDSLRLWYVFYSSIAGFIGGGSVFFLTFNVQIPPFPIVLFAFYPMIIVYAILRHRLFNIKILSTELISGIIWVLLLFRTMLANNLEDQVISGILLVLIIIFGLFLIRSVNREVEQRERIEQLATELEKSNDALAGENKSMETLNQNLAVANEKLKELDQLRRQLSHLFQFGNFCNCV